MVERLASVLNYPTSLFYRPEHVRGTDSICFHHRKRASMPVTLLTTVEANMHLTQLQVGALLEELEIHSANEFLTLDTDEYEDDPRQVAQALRRFWRLPNGPIINIVRVIEAAGGVVVFRDFHTPKLDGMSCWQKTTHPVFFLNSSMPVDRMRWTLAHELGHLVMHATPPTRNPEIEANEFASEFLAPAADIMPDLRNLKFSQLAALKSYWRLSMSAIIMTAKNTGAVPDSRIRSLYVQLSQHGWRTVEPFPLSAEEPSILAEAIPAYMDHMDYSAPEIAEIIDEFTRLYKVPDGDEGRPRLRVL